MESKVQLEPFTVPARARAFITADRLRTLAKGTPLPELQELDLSGSDRTGRIDKIENLDKLTALTALDLSHNAITKVEGLSKLPLVRLELGHNALQSLEGISVASKLRRLSASHNPLRVLSDELRHLRSLESLDVSNCEITSLREVRALRALPSLTSLAVFGNPAADAEHARAYIAYWLPSLATLDGVTVTQAERAAAKERFERDQLEELAREVEERGRVIAELRQAEADQKRAAKEFQARESKLQATIARLEGERAERDRRLTAQAAEIDVGKQEMAKLAAHCNRVQQELEFLKIDNPERARWQQPIAMIEDGRAPAAVASEAKGTQTGSLPSTPSKGRSGADDAVGTPATAVSARSASKTVTVTDEQLRLLLAKFEASRLLWEGLSAASEEQPKLVADQEAAVIEARQQLQQLTGDDATDGGADAASEAELSELRARLAEREDQLDRLELQQAALNNRLAELKDECKQGERALRARARDIAFLAAASPEPDPADVVRVLAARLVGSEHDRVVSHWIASHQLDRLSQALQQSQERAAQLEADLANALADFEAQAQQLALAQQQAQQQQVRPESSDGKHHAAVEASSPGRGGGDAAVAAAAVRALEDDLAECKQRLAETERAVEEARQEAQQLRHKLELEKATAQARERALQSELELAMAQAQQSGQQQPAQAQPRPQSADAGGHSDTGDDHELRGVVAKQQQELAAARTQAAKDARTIESLRIQQDALKERLQQEREARAQQQAELAAAAAAAAGAGSRSPPAKPAEVKAEPDPAAVDADVAAEQARVEQLRAQQAALESRLQELRQLLASVETLSETVRTLKLRQGSASSSDTAAALDKLRAWLRLDEGERARADNALFKLHELERVAAALADSVEAKRKERERERLQQSGGRDSKAAGSAATTALQAADAEADSARKVSALQAESSRLANEVAQLQQQRAQLQDKLTAAHREAGAAQQAEQSAQEATRALQRDAEVYAGRRDRAKEDLQATQKQLLDARAQLTLVNAHRDRATKQIAAAAAAASDTGTAGAGAEAGSSNGSSPDRAQLGRLAELHSELRALEQKVGEQQARLRDLQSSAGKEQSRLRDLQQDVRQHERRADTLAEQNAAGAEAAQRAQRAEAATSERLARLQAQAATAQQTVGDLTREAEQRRTELADLRSKVRAAQQAQQEAAGRLEPLAAQVERTRADAKAEAKRAADAQARLEQTQEKLTAATRQAAEQEQRAAALRKDTETQQQLFNEARARLQSLVKEVAAAEAELVKQRDEARQQEGKAAAARKAADAAAGELQSAQEQLAACNETLRAKQGVVAETQTAYDALLDKTRSLKSVLLADVEAEKAKLVELRKERAELLEQTAQAKKAAAAASAPSAGLSSGAGVGAGAGPSSGQDSALQAQAQTLAQVQQLQQRLTAAELAHSGCAATLAQAHERAAAAERRADAATESSRAMELRLQAAEQAVLQIKQNRQQQQLPSAADSGDGAGAGVAGAAGAAGAGAGDLPGLRPLVAAQLDRERDELGRLREQKRALQAEMDSLEATALARKHRLREGVQRLQRHAELVAEQVAAKMSLAQRQPDQPTADESARIVSLLQRKVQLLELRGNDLMRLNKEYATQIELLEARNVSKPARSPLQDAGLLPHKSAVGAGGAAATLQLPSFGLVDDPGVAVSPLRPQSHRFDLVMDITPTKLPARAGQPGGGAGAVGAGLDARYSTTEYQVTTIRGHVAGSVLRS